jgi:two-component system CheB/CheR fusion protein
MTSPDANTAPPPIEPMVGRQLDFPIVGLGASAGGLAALLRFFENLPSATGMAYVVILHLSPKHKSNADHVLQNATRMPVNQVTERTQIKPDHVYVIPPTHRLVVEAGHLDLQELPRAKGRHTAIDDFLRTLG